MLLPCPFHGLYLTIRRDGDIFVSQKGRSSCLFRELPCQNREYAIFFTGAAFEMGEFTCCLKQYRQRKGLTQEQLAALVGVRRETIIRLESGRYNPSLKLAVSVSRAVGAPIELLFLFD